MSINSASSSNQTTKALNSPPQIPSLPKGRAKACTSCRQVKLKCNARECFPAPCQRCKLQKLECKMDSSFRRVPARRQLEEVSNRLNVLQRSIALNQPSAPVGEAMAGNLAPDRGHWNIPTRVEYATQTFHRRASSQPFSTAVGSPQTVAPRWLDLDDEPIELQWQIGDIVVNYEDSVTLFRHFDEILFRHLPILEPCPSIQALYQSSHLLYWAIILISARMHALYGKLYQELVPHVRALTSTKLLDVPHTLKLLHAILIMCTWPSPVISQWEDPTWMLSGSAINIAMTMGIHKPGHQHEYGRAMAPVQGSPYIRNVTWLACFHMATCLSSWMGMPPPLSTPAHLDVIALLCKDESMPRSLRAKSEIQRQVAQYMTLLDAQVDARTRHALITVVEQDLNRTRSSFGDVSVEELDVEILGAKIYLYGLTFVNNQRPDSGIPHAELSFLAKRETLQRGLGAAIRLLHCARHLRLPGVAPVNAPEGHPSSPEYLYQLGFYPKHFFYTVFVANIFLLWFLAVDLQASDADKELARHYVAASHRLFSSYSHNAELTRCARTMEVLGRMPNVAGRSPSLRVNSRLGASFMYDAIYNASFYRHAMAQASAASESSNLTTATAIALPGHPSTGVGVRHSLSGAQQSPISLNGAGVKTGQNMGPDGQMSSVNPVTTAVEVDVYDMLPEMTGLQAVEFPWGVWDNAIYDDLNVGMDLEHIAYEAQPYWQ